MIKKFKIYGCRNSGTNYLWHLVERNFDIHYVGNGAGKHKHSLPRYFHDPESLVLMITKNPYSWLLSRKRKPHLGAVGDIMKNANWADFLDTPYNCFAGSVCKWNKMSLAFIEANTLEQYEHVKYEDLLLHGEDVLNELAEKYDIDKTAKFFDDIRRETAADPNKPLKDKKYDRRNYYEKELWKNEYSRNMVEAVNERLDNWTVKHSGYELLKPKNYG